VFPDTTEGYFAVLDGQRLLFDDTDDGSSDLIDYSLSGGTLTVGFEDRFDVDGDGSEEPATLEATLSQP
jgi:hypothetical protein